MSRRDAYADVLSLTEIRVMIFDSELFSQGHVDAFDRLLEEAGHDLVDLPYPEVPEDPNEGMPWPI